MILFHDLGGTGKPVVCPGIRDIGKVIGERRAVLVVDPGVCRTIERGIGWVVDVGRECTALSVEEVVLDTVRGRAQMQPFGANRFGQVADEVAFGPS